jgi:site-specific DNA-cytosine methylase
VDQARLRLERGGYFVSVVYHNLAGFGLPQERFRALIVAMRRPFDPVRPFLRREEFRTVRDAIGDLPALDAGGRDPLDELHYTVRHKESTVNTIRQVPRDGGSLPGGVGPACLERALLRNGKKAYEDVYGRLYWDRPAITITSHARTRQAVDLSIRTKIGVYQSAKQLCCKAFQELIGSLVRSIAGSAKLEMQSHRCFPRFLRHTLQASTLALMNRTFSIRASRHL